MFDFIQKLVHIFLIAIFGFILLLLFSVKPLMGIAVSVGAGLIFYKIKLATNTYNFFSKSNADNKISRSLSLSRSIEPVSSKKSPYEIVIENSKDLEGRLAKIGATGKGLHEKTSSVSSLLPVELVKELRTVATIRNKLVHEEDFSLTSRELEDFEDLAYSAYRTLRNLPVLPTVATHKFTCSKCNRNDIAHVTMKQAVPLFAHCQHCGEKLDLESEGFVTASTAS
ncbi:hypothetical protein [Vibrio rotiferianus]|uniref:hypothetical protein n=1 Tax=Vibrio rotiferianus TaxID=190895 RepID=UPI002174D9F4|nr:hypothetical protein [Vibrio rotiferianus]